MLRVLQLLATSRAVDDRSVDFEEPLLNLVIRAGKDALPARATTGCGHALPLPPKAA